MQTFLPYNDFARSAEVLDRARLGKQRVEVKQIIQTLDGQSFGWRHHPAVKMWEYRTGALALYGLAMCDEWIGRGYKDSLRSFFQARAMVSTPNELLYPDWFGWEDFHLSHQSNLVRKFPEHYVPYFGQVPSVPYVWPA